MNKSYKWTVVPKNGLVEKVDNKIKTFESQISDRKNIFMWNLKGLCTQEGL